MEGGGQLTQVESDVVRRQFGCGAGQHAGVVRQLEHQRGLGGCGQQREFGRVEVAYAGKALLCTAMCRIMQQEGMALDTASTGELFTAVSAGFPLNKVKLHGNFKTDELLGMALKYQVGRIVADSITELQRLSRIAVEMGKEADILIRVGPGIKTQTHSYIQTGQADSKFGLSIASGAAMEGIKLALSLPGIDLRGLHCHIGSQLFGLDSYARTVEMMTEFIRLVRAETNWTCDELDLGGGLGIAYTPEDAPPSVAELADVICPALKSAAEAQGLPLPKLILEPGRSIVGPAGTTLYTVGPVKVIPGVRTYVAVDGGLDPATGDRPEVARRGGVAAVVGGGHDGPGEGVFAVGLDATGET